MFEDVKVVRRTAKALLCKFEGGRYERFVPLSQIEDAPDVGETGDLSVTAWMAAQWEEEGEPEADTFAIDGAVALGESEKGLRVQSPAYTGWLPKNGVHPDSEVLHDGDGPGKLLLHAWCAKSKNLVGDAQPAARPARNVGDDARQTSFRRSPARDAAERDAREADGPDPTENSWDDDLPF